MWDLSFSLSSVLPFLAGMNLRLKLIWFLSDYSFLPGLGYMLAVFSACLVQTGTVI